MTNRSFCNRAQLRPRTKAGKSRIKTWLLVTTLAAGAFLTSPKTEAGGDAPGWMHALTNAPLPKHDEKTEAVLLYSEEILTVQPDGKMREIDRAAYKILRPSGRHLGKLRFYVNNESRITHIHGWCIPAQGKDYEVKDKDIIENGLLGAEYGILYWDDRVKVMEIPAPEPGNIIGYEVEHEDRRYVLQDYWNFQGIEPVADARYTLQLPAGWEYKAVWMNHAEMPPTSSGNNQWQWELKDISEIKQEEYMPPWQAVAGLMIVSIVPPSGAGRGFLTWPEMGAWYGGLAQGRRDPSPELKQKVADLTAKTSTPMGKMVALTDFMQSDIRYVAILLGIGGVQPHPARDIFANRYGDCKDKATLLSTMLKEVGIDSYYVVIHTERGGVTPSTPPHVGAFNHMILAIRLPEGVSDGRLIATLQDAKLGRLLIFDPTDEFTPFGSLRGELQGTYALLVTPDGGELVQMPQLLPVTSGVRRTAKLTLNSSGTLRGDVEDERVGDSGWWQRAELRGVEKDADRIKPLENLMSHSLGSYTITKATVTNVKETSLPFVYKWSFVAQDYGKTAGNLLLVRPRVLGVESRSYLETKEPRKYPVEFYGPAYDSDNFEITLPPGYVVDDLPAATDVDYSFGSYHSKTVVDGNIIRYTRTFEIKQVSVPVDKLEDLKKFYRIISADERNTAVLKPAGT